MREEEPHAIFNKEMMFSTLSIAREKKEDWKGRDLSTKKYFIAMQNANQHPTPRYAMSRKSIIYVHV